MHTVVMHSATTTASQPRNDRAGNILKGDGKDPARRKLQRRRNAREIREQVEALAPSYDEELFARYLEDRTMEEVYCGLTDEDVAAQEAAYYRAMDEAYMAARPSCMENPANY